MTTTALLVLIRLRLLVWRPINNWPTQGFAFRRRGKVQPGRIFSKVCRHRDSFSTMDCTVAVQTNGFGFSFQAARNSVIAFSRSSTLPKEPRRIRLLVNSPNQRSTRFSQLELVGTKCEIKRGCRFIQAWTRGCLWVP